MGNGQDRVREPPCSMRARLRVAGGSASLPAPPRHRSALVRAHRAGLGGTATAHATQTSSGAPVLPPWPTSVDPQIRHDIASGPAMVGRRWPDRSACATCGASDRPAWDIWHGQVLSLGLFGFPDANQGRAFLPDMGNAEVAPKAGPGTSCEGLCGGPTLNAVVPLGKPPWASRRARARIVRDATKAHLTADRAEQVSQPDTKANAVLHRTSKQRAKASMLRPFSSLQSATAAGGWAHGGSLRQANRVPERIEKSWRHALQRHRVFACGCAEIVLQQLVGARHAHGGSMERPGQRAGAPRLLRDAAEV